MPEKINLDTPPGDPCALFDAWFAEATASEASDPNAMTVATATPAGRPAARILLLKGRDSRGFVFFTNIESRKADELTANPRVALLFHWKSLQRQVRIEGPVERVTDAEADAYYATRARVSRLGAWASEQSRPLAARNVLEARVAEFDAKFPGEAIPRPPHWGGYRCLPEHFEFWQERPFRLHDRVTYTPRGTPQGTPDSAGWSIVRLYP